MTGSLTATPGGKRRQLVKCLAVLAALALFLLGIIHLGKLALEQVRGKSGTTTAFADIDCTPPLGQQRPAFLAEVQYLAEMPDQLPILDKGLAKRLAVAFARHPRVAKVIRVELTPPDRVHIELRYRIPVLAVAVGGQLRAVDGQGVLLPRDTPTKGLTVFSGQAAPPKGPAGTPWGDPAVETAARRAARSTDG